MASDINRRHALSIYLFLPDGQTCYIILLPVITEYSKLERITLLWVLRSVFYHCFPSGQVLLI